MSKQIEGSFDSKYDDLTVNTCWVLSIRKEFSTLEVWRTVWEEGSGDHSSRAYLGLLEGRPFRFIRTLSSGRFSTEELFKMKVCAEDISFRCSRLLDWDEMADEVIWEVCAKVRTYI